MRIKKSFVAAALSMTITLGLTACGATGKEAGASTGNGAAYKAGTYQAMAKGHNGDLTAEVVVSDSSIVSVDITSHIETDGVSDAAIEQIPKAIVDGQTLKVDAVSGATVTSKAILKAVEQALTEAEADIEALKTAKAD